MPRSRGVFSETYRPRGDRRAALGVLASVIGVLILVFAIFFGGEYFQRLAAYRDSRAQELWKLGDPATEPVLEPPPVGLKEPIRSIILNTIPELPLIGDPEALLESGLPVYDLRIRPKQLKELQATAEQVTAGVYSTGIPRDYVPATFYMDGQWLPIKVKLRGLTYMHYIKARPSLRLKFPGERLFEGKSQINLLDPYDKDLTGDVTTNHVAKELGLLTWDSRFVVLRLNDEVVGLFQEIEHFGRSISDRNGRPEGYIFSGLGQLFGKEGLAYDKARAAIELVIGCQGGPVAPAEYCDWEFVQDYFDVDRFAWAAALSIVHGSSHGFAPDNLRLFWDPARGRFEPIPWDYGVHSVSIFPDGEVFAKNVYGKTFLGIPEFRRMVDERVWFLLTERIEPMIEQADALFEELSEPLKSDTRHPDFALDLANQASYRSTLRDNRRILEAKYRNQRLTVAWQPDGAGRVAIGVTNHGRAFVTIREVILTAGGRTSQLALDPEVVVDGSWLGVPAVWNFSLDVPEGVRVAGLVVENGVTGATLAQPEIEIVKQEGARLRASTKPAPPPLEIDLPNVRVDSTQVRFGPGAVQLTRSLEIPSTHDVVFAPGLLLEMAKGVSLIIYGDLRSRGTESAPVRIQGLDGDPAWGGILVHGTRTEPREVELEHTMVTGGSGGESRRIYFSSPFSVHDGVVTVRSSVFRGSLADDGINLKYCKIDLRGNRFLGSRDDAVDFDFCNGEFAAAEILDSGGDGLDLSGSKLIAKQVVVEGCGDKGMSIGENTRVLVTESSIDGCTTGIAVKDRSVATLRGNRLSDLDVGIAAYVKKPTFGPSHATLEDTEFRDVETKFLRDGTCTIEEN